MFVYRHFRRWGFGVGIVPFVLIVLPLMLAWAIARGALMAVGEVVIVTGRVTAWAWRRSRAPKAGTDDTPPR